MQQVRGQTVAHQNEVIPIDEGNRKIAKYIVSAFGVILLAYECHRQWNFKVAVL